MSDAVSGGLESMMDDLGTRTSALAADCPWRLGLSVEPIVVIRDESGVVEDRSRGGQDKWRCDSVCSISGRDASITSASLSSRNLHVAHENQLTGPAPHSEITDASSVLTSS